MSVVDGQPAAVQLRAMNGQLTWADVRALPESQMPESFSRPRTINETMDIVARAVAAHFRVGVCVCGGTEIFSKVKPWARCMRCGTCRDVGRVQPVATRRRCKQCRQFFRSVTKFLKCPACRERGPSEPEPSPTKIKPRDEPLI